MSRASLALASVASRTLFLSLALIASVTLVEQAEAQWVLQGTPTVNPLRGIHFPVNAATGYAVGNAGTIIKTTDGGALWSSLASGVGDNLNFVQFPTDATTGYIAGNLGLILKTTNGGTSWSPQATPTIETLNGLYFPLNATTGWAVGKAGVILKTTNGGTSWVAQPSGTGVDLVAVQFPVDAVTGYVVGKSGLILKTTDGGASWTPQATPTAEPFTALDFPVDATTGYASGNAGVILKTTNGGATWVALASGVGDNLSDVQFPTDATTGYVTGKLGLILKTTNGGTSWVPEVTPTAEDLRSLHFPEAATGYATGNAGIMLKLGTGGSGGASVVVTPDTATASRLPSNGTNYTAAFTVINDGSGSDDFDLLTTEAPGTAISVVSITGTGVTQGANPDSARVASVAATDSVLVTVTYSVADVAAGVTDTLFFTARSVGDPSATDDGRLELTVIKPNMTTAKAVNPTGTQLPGTDLTYTLTITNDGSQDATGVVVVDSLPAEIDFKVGSVVNNLPSGVTATVEYSDDGASTWTYVPVSVGCSAPATYDACVTHIRWTLQNDLSYVGPDNTGNVEFVARIQ